MSKWVRPCAKETVLTKAGSGQDWAQGPLFANTGSGFSFFFSGKTS